MNKTVENWLCMSQEELDGVYKKALPGTIPAGNTDGTAILPGSPLSKAFAGLAKAFAWKGKVFDLFSPDETKGVLTNKISLLSLPLIVAKVYKDKSWLDGKDTIVIDYGKTSLLAQKIRDEIREVEPGLYLGKVWWGQNRVLDFALESKP